MSSSERILAYMVVPFRVVGVFLYNICLTLWSLSGTARISKRSSSKHRTISYAAVGDFRYFWQRQIQVTTSIFQDAYAKTSLMCKSPNPNMLRLDNNSTCQLLDVAKEGRPLVINFGSCSLPPFIANLENFRKMTEEFSAVADFVLVYIAEANPTDGWAIRGNVEVAKHKCMEDRVAAANLMLSMEPQSCPVLVDLMEDSCNEAFAALPDRLYIVQDGVIVYKGGLGTLDYKIHEVHTWLSFYTV